MCICVFVYILLFDMGRTSVSLLSRGHVKRIFPDSTSGTNDGNYRIGEGESGCNCCKKCDDAYYNIDDDIYYSNDYKTVLYMLVCRCDS